MLNARERDRASMWMLARTLRVCWKRRDSSKHTECSAPPLAEKGKQQKTKKKKTTTAEAVEQVFCCVWSERGTKHITDRMKFSNEHKQMIK